MPYHFHRKLRASLTFRNKFLQVLFRTYIFAVIHNGGKLFIVVRSVRLVN